MEKLRVMPFSISAGSACSRREEQTIKATDSVIYPFSLKQHSPGLNSVVLLCQTPAVKMRPAMSDLSVSPQITREGF